MLATLHTVLALGPNWMDPEWLLDRYGQELLWIAMLIVFVECGLLFPILPGDSLLFSIGLFISRHEAGEPGIDTSLLLACVLLTAAAFLGNVSGYEIGRLAGHRLQDRDGRIVKAEYLTKTHAFFDTYGNRALVLGRFVPIVRTYITVVAGIGEMDRKRFFTWSLIGATLWACGLTTLGYLLGGVEFLQHNLEAAILLIVAISVLPMVWEYVRHRREVNEVVEELAEEFVADEEG